MASGAVMLGLLAGDKQIGKPEVDNLGAEETMGPYLEQRSKGVRGEAAQEGGQL